MSGVTIELEGLELRGFHGALAEERKRQTFLSTSSSSRKTPASGPTSSATPSTTRRWPRIREVSDGQRYN